MFNWLLLTFFFSLNSTLGKDLIAMTATFVLCLAIGVEYGILVGVAINIVFLLYPSARPSVHVEQNAVSI